MKFSAFAVCLALISGGCAKDKLAVSPEGKPPKAAQAPLEEKNKKKTEKPSRPKPADSKPIITPDDSSAGKVVLVNRNARFVVISFSQGNVPATGRKLNVYRNGLKVAELKITGPQQDDNTVGDIMTGQVQVKDEVREE
jgi:hypothetical protein